MRDLNHTRCFIRAKASYVLEAFAGVKIRKKERLTGRYRLVMLARLPHLQ